MKTLPEAFREEVKSWRLSFQEESMLIAFMACVHLRMKGVEPTEALGMSSKVGAK